MKTSKAGLIELLAQIYTVAGNIDCKGKDKSIIERVAYIIQRSRIGFMDSHPNALTKQVWIDKTRKNRALRMMNYKMAFTALPDTPPTVPNDTPDLAIEGLPESIVVVDLEAAA